MQENVLSTQNNPIRTVFDDVESASEALLKRWETDAKPEPSANRAAQEATEQEADETNQPFVQEDEVDPNDLPEPEEIDEDPVDDAEEVEQDTSDEEVEEIEIDDDTLIDVVVNGNAEQASIKDLKRLWGQEKALTQKSQEVASQRKQLEDNIGKTDVIFQKLIEKAEAKWKPYSEVDMLVASQSMDTEDFAQLRKEAQTAQDELRFLNEEANNFYGELRQQQQSALQEQAKEAVKVLEKDIDGWNNDLYEDIRTYAIAQGLPEDQVNQYVDPTVIKILNKARLFDAAKKVTTTKKKRVAKAVLKSKKAPENDQAVKARKVKATRAKLTNSHDMDDIADALLSRWEQ